MSPLMQYGHQTWVSRLELMAMMPSPWRAQGDTESAFMSWTLQAKGLGKYISQYRLDRRFYLWVLPTGFVEPASFLGVYDNATELMEAQKADWALRHFAPAKENPSRTRPNRRRARTNGVPTIPGDPWRVWGLWGGWPGHFWEATWEPNGTGKGGRLTFPIYVMSAPKKGTPDVLLRVRPSAASMWEQIDTYRTASAAAKAAREDFALRSFAPAQYNPRQRRRQR